MTRAKEHTGPVWANRYECRVCGCEQIRHFLSAYDFERDIVSQNSLCIPCFVEKKFDPATLIPRESLPVIRAPRLDDFSEQPAPPPKKRGRPKKKKEEDGGDT